MPAIPRLPFPALAGLVLALSLSACGGEPEPPAAARSQASPATTGSAPEDSPFFGEGALQLAGSENFDTDTDAAKLSCGTAPGRPFVAQWEDPATGVAVKVSGFPQDGSHETRVDSFQLANVKPGSERRGRLASATLAVEKLGERGRIATYRVSASGQLEDGGEFTATGRCNA